MSRPETPIRVNAPGVAFEVIEDEAIVINFESGAYHSLRGVARRAWQIIAQTTTHADLTEALAVLYEGEREQIRSSVDAFLTELEGADLITFDPAAIRAIAKRAIERGTGARGLRSVIESIMRDVMFEIPSRGDVREVVVTPECVERGVPPLLVLHPESAQSKKEA